MSKSIERSAKVLRDLAMAYPEAHEDHPWGEIAVKVRGKAFLFMHAGAETLSLTCKLPASHEAALLLPFAKPTGYGLGKSGWVSASFAGNESPPIEMLREWIDESYRAIAPKRLSAALEGAVGAKSGTVKAGKEAGAREGVKTSTASKGGVKAGGARGGGGAAKKAGVKKRGTGKKAGGARAK